MYAAASFAVQLFGIRLVGIDDANGRKILASIVFLAVIWGVTKLVQGIIRTVVPHDTRAAFWSRQFISVAALILTVVALISVEARQYSGRIVSVSNAQIFDEPVFNYTRDFPYLGEEMRVPISYKDDRARAERILLNAAELHALKDKDVPADAMRELQRRYHLRHRRPAAAQRPDRSAMPVTE